jgi:membrane protein
VVERLLGPLARRWSWVRTALAVQSRFSEVHGNHLAAAVTLAAFLSIFPLLLVVVAIVGKVAADNTALVPEFIERLGLTGEAETAVVGAIEKAVQSRRAASAVGIAGLLWSGLGLVAALQYAFDNVWQVSGRGLKDKLGGLLWLVGAAVILIASLGLTAVLNFLPELRLQGVAPVALVLGVAVNLALWLWAMVALTNSSVGWRAMVPGAVLGAVGLEVLKVVGSVYVPRIVASSSALYGSIGVVFAILAWLLFLGRLIVYAAVLNVVKWEQRHGTVTVEIELPKHPDAVPVEATRAGEARTPA